MKDKKSKDNKNPSGIIPPRFKHDTPIPGAGSAIRPLDKLEKYIEKGKSLH